MTIIERRVKECPQCRRRFDDYGLVSGNTFGAKFWTDGKREAPMWPDESRLLKCPKCDELMWIPDIPFLDVKAIEKEERAERVKLCSENIFPGFSKINIQRAKDALLGDPKEPDEGEYLFYLNSNDFPYEKEKYLRIRAWWKINDIYRESTKNILPKYSQAQKKSILKLFSLLNIADPNERIMKAEIARELGFFDQALLLLDTAFSESMRPHYDLILSLAKKKIRLVAEVKTEK